MYGVSALSVFPRTSLFARVVIAIATSIAGITTMIAILVAMNGSFAEDKIMLPSAAFGALLSGFAFVAFFGQFRKSKGWLLATAGSLLATALGSFLGGVVWGILICIVEGVPGGETLPLFLLQTGAFAFMVVMVIASYEHPVLFGLWLLLMAAVQCVAILVRKTYRTAA